LAFVVAERKGLIFGIGQQDLRVPCRGGSYCKRETVVVSRTAMADMCDGLRVETTGDNDQK
jgi:hypothetical protein